MALVRNRRWDYLAANALGPRGLRGDLRRPHRPAEPRPLRVPRRARADVLRGLGRGGARHGPDPALRRPAATRSDPGPSELVEELSGGKRGVPRDLGASTTCDSRRPAGTASITLASALRSRVRGSRPPRRPRPDAPAGDRGARLADGDGAAAASTLTRTEPIAGRARTALRHARRARTRSGSAHPATGRSGRRAARAGPRRRHGAHAALRRQPRHRDPGVPRRRAAAARRSRRGTSPGRSSSAT